jgi:serine/threonine protein kinase
VAPIEQMTVIGDRYEVVGALDAGGTGVVYRALDRRLGRPVAVKVVRTTEPRLARRSAREARLLARVNHPNVVRVYDAGVHDDHPYIVTELVGGRPLSHLLGDGRLAPEMTAAVGAGAAAGLAATHRVGIVHRDLKPANILVSDRGVVRLLDYGVASIADGDTLTLDGEVVGTPRYLAPEQVSGGDVGPAADVYALGLVLIECLTGQHPFGGTAMESMGARLTREPTVPALPTEPWTAILAAMTAREPDRRPTAAEVAERLGPIGAGADLRRLVSPNDITETRDGITTTELMPSLVPSTEPTGVMATGVMATGDPATGTRPRAARPRRRRRRAVLLVVGVLALAGSAVGSLVVADRAGEGGTTPTTASTAPSTSSAPTPTTIRVPTTTVRPTTTTAPPTTTTTTGKGRGGKPGKGRPGR